MCRNCRKIISNATFGSKNRNHCPYCLYSLHVDMETGDKLSACKGIMEPIAVSIRHKGEWELVHRCRTCGSKRVNRIAGDDSEGALMALALKPITNLPFPLDTLYML